jgi:serine phosphatase RsbU (regulator of sigma subunit)
MAHLPTTAPPTASATGPSRLLRASVELTRQVLAAAGPDQVPAILDRAVEVVAGELAAPHVGLFEAFDHLGHLQGRSGVLDGRPVGGRGAAVMRLPTGRGSMPGYTLLAGATIVSDDLLADRRFVALAPTLGVGARSAVNVPVGWGQRTWGVLGVYDVRSRAWTDDEVAFVESVAGALAMLLRVHDAGRYDAGRHDADPTPGHEAGWDPDPTPDRERLTAERRARRRAERAGARLATLSEATALFFQSLDRDVIAAALAEFCVPDLAELCRVDLPDEHGRLRAGAVRGGTDAQRAALDGLAAYCPADLADLLDRDQPADGTGPAASAPRVHDGIDDRARAAAATSPEHRRLLNALAPTAVVVTPLAARGRVVGVLTLIDVGTGPRPADHLVLLEELAGRAALALDNSFQFESRSRMLDSLQSTLTPRALPGPGLLVFAARYQAADPHAAVGGDFYDVIDLGEGGWGAVVGDICGRGHDAAALTGLVRHSVRAAVVNDPRPRPVLHQTNAAVVTQLDDFRFCTATYVHSVPHGDGVRVAASSAGHPRPVVVRAGGGAHLLDCGGVPLGVVADPDLTEAEVVLRPGDALVLYTDGVTEARNPAGLFGEDRLLDVLGAAAGRTADAIAGALDEAVRAHRAGSDDDLAILVIQVARR